MKEFREEILSSVLKHCKFLIQNPIISLSGIQDTSQISIDFCLLFSHAFKQVKINNCGLFWPVKHEIPVCSNMTHLILSNQTVADEIVWALSAAVRDGRLPRLSHLGFIKCEGIKGKLPVLFRSTWPKLTHLNLCKTLIDEIDVRSLLDSNVTLLPKLTSCTFSISKAEEPDQVLQPQLKHKCPPLTSLVVFVDDPTGNSYSELTEALGRGKFPNLAHLGVSVSQSEANSNTSDLGVGSSLPNVVEINPNSLNLEKLTSLESLVLREIITSVNHTETIVRKLYQLTLSKLDLSHSLGLTGNLSVLLHHSFPSLNSLVLSDCGLISQDLCSLDRARLKGRLPQLRHLDISKNNDSKLFPKRPVCFFLSMESVAQS